MFSLKSNLVSWVWIWIILSREYKVCCWLMRVLGVKTSAPTSNNQLRRLLAFLLRLDLGSSTLFLPIGLKTLRLINLEIFKITNSMTTQCNLQEPLTSTKTEICSWNFQPQMSPHLIKFISSTCRGPRCLILLMGVSWKVFKRSRIFPSCIWRLSQLREN